MAPVALPKQATIQLRKRTLAVSGGLPKAAPYTNELDQAAPVEDGLPGIGLTGPSTTFVPKSSL